jgi:phage terminase small subunit
MSKDALKLTPKQQRFADEYLVDLNATAAYKRAGYLSKGNAAEVCASKLLSNAKVTTYISAKRLQVSNKLDITVERVLAEYAKIAFVDVRKFYDEHGHLRPIHMLDDETAGALAGLEVDEISAGENVIGQTKKIKITDKKGALDSIAKHLGMFVEKVEVTGNVTILASSTDEKL